MNIAEIRQKYPQYNNVNDDALAKALHRKYYADKMSINDFRNKIGLGQPMQAETPLAPMSQSMQKRTLGNMPIDEYLSNTQKTATENADLELKALTDRYQQGIDAVGYTPVISDASLGLGNALYGIGEIGASLSDRYLGTDYLPTVQKHVTARDKAIENTQDKRGIKYASDITEAVAPAFIGGGGIVAGAGIGALTTPSYSNTGKPKDVFDNAMQNTALGIATGGVLKGGGKLAKKTGEIIIPPAKKEIVKLANIAKNKFGINLRLDQVARSRPRDTFQKLSQNIPYSGVDTQEEQAYKQWNKSIAKTLGVEADDLSPETITQFKNANSSKFKDALEDVDVTFDGQQLNQALNEISDSAKTNLSDGSDAQKVVNNYVNMFNENFDSAKGITTEIGVPKSKPQTDIAIKGQTRKATEYDIYDINSKVLNGNKAHSLRSNLVKASVDATPEAKRYIAKMINVLDDVLEQNIPKAKAQTLKQARREYRNFKTIQPLLEGSTDGLINPTSLMNRVKSSKYINASTLKDGEDDLVDLARIGKEFLPKKGGSDTAHNQVGYQVLGGGSGVATLGGSIGINTAFQKGLNQNQKAVAKSLKGGGINALNVLSRGADKLAPQSARMTGQAMNAVTNQQEQNPRPKSNSDFDKGYQEYLKRKQLKQSNESFNANYEKWKANRNKPVSSPPMTQYEREVKGAESSGRNSAKSTTSSAEGLYGFTDDTWRRAVNKWGREMGVTLADRKNTDAQTAMFLKLSEDNKRLGEKSLGRPIDNKENYVLHFMGHRQGVKLINLVQKNPTALGKNIFPKEAEANRPVFYAKNKNGFYTIPRTIAEVQQILKQKVS